MQVSLQHMRHHHLRRRGQRRIDAGDRIADVTAELMRGDLEVGQAFGGGAGHLKAGGIALVHWNSPGKCVGVVTQSPVTDRLKYLMNWKV